MLDALEALKNTNCNMIKPLIKEFLPTGSSLHVELYSLLRVRKTFEISKLFKVINIGRPVKTTAN